MRREVAIYQFRCDGTTPDTWCQEVATVEGDGLPEGWFRLGGHPEQAFHSRTCAEEWRAVKYPVQDTWDAARAFDTLTRQESK